MTSRQPLHGSCHCGRNQYAIQLPEDVSEHAEIYFDSSRDSRRIHGTPLTAWLRVPLDWYQSHTESYFADESRATIRRIFSPAHAPHSQRAFCGFCGTPLSYWTDAPSEEANYMSVTIGSLSGDDQRLLEYLGLLSEDEDEDMEAEGIQEDRTTGVPAQTTQAPFSSSHTIIPSSGGTTDISTYRHGTLTGIPWFEEMIEGSRLGRLMKSRRGFGISDDQSTTIQWEVSEWTNDGSEGVKSSSSSGKRKRGQHTNVKESKLP
ncbi:uncharacterized protein BDW43DRAFT_261255 [Aspergillus alliaceus]|uniref:uncharacterized protein n=1 Tax=Petromyces alliaceus TaxID=209559 RepID=UPI0012A4A148|nr:uncharacterized protein BDW43DRAFT_261255 [Aspergillus alliaceus]KAB8238306.1 hypothetical protein BDW43DRAFT_261255 [Aspergillus alliaceus]